MNGEVMGGAAARTGVTATLLAVILAACAGSGGGATVAPVPSRAPVGTTAPSTGAGGAPSAARGVELAIAHDATLGDHLVGPDGKTLYLFTKDSPRTSACSDTCAATWPPLLAGDGGAPTAAAGITGKIGTITRGDGRVQVTLSDVPLYTYSGDTAEGQTTGQGFGGFWFVVSPAGQAINGGGAAPSPTMGGYDY
jgi:predicted lipoprotein with Yx(FWY)xxD motif